MVNFSTPLPGTRATGDQVAPAGDVNLLTAALTELRNAGLLNDAEIRGLISQVAPATASSTFRHYDVSGSAWPARGSTTSPVVWTSTKTPAAARPSDMAVGDMWIQHPDAANN